MSFFSNVLISLGILIEAFVSTYIITVISKILSKKKEKVNYEDFIYCGICIFTVYLFNQIIFSLYPQFIIFRWIISFIAIPIFSSYFLKNNYLISLLTFITVLLLDAITEIIIYIILNMFKIDIVNITNTLFLGKIILILFMSILKFTLIFYINTRYNQKHIKRAEISFARFMIPQFLAVSISLFPTMILIMSNRHNFTATFLIINLFQLFVITIVSIYNLNNVVKQKFTESKLENTIVHNETLLKVNDGVRGFKHDMGNIVQAIIGYMAIGDIDGAKKFCQNLVNGFNDINVLSILSPEIINDPAIYGVVVNKILVAREKEMSLSLDINLNVAEINFPKFELSRILGILIDNAIEAGEKTEDKKLILDMHTDYKENIDVIKIANSIENLNIDVNKVFEKDYSTKENPSGYGLYSVRKYFNKYLQANIETCIDKENKLFCQTIYISKVSQLQKAG